MSEYGNYLLDSIYQEEGGFEPNIYKVPWKNKKTGKVEKIPHVGIGFNIGLQKDGKTPKSPIYWMIPEDVRSGKRPMKREEADDIYKAYMSTQAIPDAKKYIGDDIYEMLGEPRQNALIEMAYVLGLPSLNTFEKTKKAILSGDWQNAKKEALDSRWWREGNATIKNRVERIADMLLTGRSLPVRDTSLLEKGLNYLSRYK